MSAYFSLWGRHVRGVLVCRIRSTCRSCDTPLFPCRWWPCVLQPRCPWHLRYEGGDEGVWVGNCFVPDSAGILLDLASALGDAIRSCQTSCLVAVPDSG